MKEFLADFSCYSSSELSLSQRSRNFVRRPFPRSKYVFSPDLSFVPHTLKENKITKYLYTVGWGKSSLNDPASGPAFGAPGQDPESFRSKGIHLISSIRTLCRGAFLIPALA